MHARVGLILTANDNFLLQVYVYK